MRRLGRSGGPAAHADAVGPGRSGTKTWPKIVNDAANNSLKEIYAPGRRLRAGAKAFAAGVPAYSVGTQLISISSTIVPKLATPMLRKLGAGLGGPFAIIPVESGRGCPYGLRSFATVTGFFRGLDSISDEQECRGTSCLLLKSGGLAASGGPRSRCCFVIDDNFAHQT